MPRHLNTLLALCLLSGAVSVMAADKDAPTSRLPYTPGLDLAAMDRSVDPCQDFYQYSCGGWRASNPIPSDESSWSVYGKLYQDNQRFLWGILQSLESGQTTRTPDQQKIGDYFHACMDEERINSLGMQPIMPLLERIDATTSKADLVALLAELQASTGSPGFFFSFGSSQDFADSSQTIGFASAGGLGLPDRDYYLKTDAKSAHLRELYLQHVEHSFELIGEDTVAANADTRRVMAIETALARATLTQTEGRDPYKLFHNMTTAQLQKLSPAIDWRQYFDAIGLGDLQRVNVVEPKFYRTLSQQLNSASPADLRAYLKWHVVRADSSYLSAPFVDEDFAFYGKTLRGTPEQRPRWKRCVKLIDQQLGDALGREFVARSFTPELKAKVVQMTKQIETAMAEEIDHLNWMTPPTKARAMEKLHSLINKIGYPERWRDYATVDIKPDDFFHDVVAGNRFEFHRDLGKIGKPVDRQDWEMSAPTVDAYYDAQLNTINFPAGVLQPPLYDPKMDDAPNYGNTGGTIGHELTHGFDDEGRKFDAEGNLKDWWSKADAAKFDKLEQCTVDQFASYTVVDDVHINSRLTLGEDTADLGGLILALSAWKTATAGQALENRDGMTPDQRFFVGYAQWACSNVRPEQLRLQAATDPHSPGVYRVNGLVSNMAEFQEAFSCKAGQPMVRPKPCRVW